MIKHRLHNLTDGVATAVRDGHKTLGVQLRAMLNAGRHKEEATVAGYRSLDDASALADHLARDRIIARPLSSLESE
jgi:hypothetical protein